MRGNRVRTKLILVVVVSRLNPPPRNLAWAGIRLQLFNFQFLENKLGNSGNKLQVCNSRLMTDNFSSRSDVVIHV